MRRAVMVLAGALALTACEQTPPSVLDMSSPEPARFLLAVPDPEFRLTHTDRAKLSPAIDPDGLERLLAHIRPEHRSTILDDLNELGSHGPVAFGALTTSISAPEFRDAVAAVFRAVPRQSGTTRP